MELIAAAAEKPVPVLGGHGRGAQVVVLHGRHADDLVHSHERPVEERPALDEGGARRDQLLEVRGCGEVDARAGVDRGGTDAAALEARLRRFDGVVDDAHLGCTGLACQRDERDQHLGIGRRPERRHALERDVRLDQHAIAGLHEMGHAADRVDGGPHHRVHTLAAGDA